MKIAYIIPSLVNQGPNIVIKNIVDNTDKSIHHVVIYYFDEKETILDFSCECIRIHETDLIDFDSFDIIHSNCLRPDRYLSSCKSKGKIKKAKTVSTLHQDTYKTFIFQYNIVLAFLYSLYWLYYQRKLDSIVTISNMLNDKYSFLLKNCKTIYNGCSITKDETGKDIKFEFEIKELKKHYKLIGAYAYITKRKGFDQVLEFLRENKDYAFVLIGEGIALDWLKSIIDKYGLNERVLLHSYVVKPYQYLNEVDVFVMPSYSEGFGLSMVEAAMSNKPIVCSDIPSFHEIFSDEEACFFELNNRISLDNAIKEAYLQKDKLGYLAKNKANECFSSFLMANNYLDHYQSLINEK